MIFMNVVVNFKNLQQVRFPFKITVTKDVGTALNLAPGLISNTHLHAYPTDYC